MPRPYKNTRGVVTSGIALALVSVALTGVYASIRRAFNYTLGFCFVIGRRLLTLLQQAPPGGEDRREGSRLLADAERGAGNPMTLDPGIGRQPRTWSNIVKNALTNR